LITTKKGNAQYYGFDFASLAESLTIEAVFSIHKMAARILYAC